MALSNIDQMFIKAASIGDIDKVGKALASGADIHAEDDNAIRLAAQFGWRKTVALLLDRGADIHAENDYALIWAATNRHTETVRLLLNRGADIHANNDQALRMAGFNNQKEMILLLLRHGADPEVKGGEGTDLAEWLEQIKQETPAYFASGTPSREQCFSTDETGIKLNDKVLDACLTGQFSNLIGVPLVASANKADCPLFQEIWDKLPVEWQDSNQDIYMQFAKKGEVTPIVGHHTTAAQRDPATSGIVAGR